MLRFQLLLALLITSLLLTVAGFAVGHMLLGLGIGHWTVLSVSVAYVGLRLIVPFRLQDEKPLPTDALTRTLSVIQVMAVFDVALPAGWLGGDLHSLTSMPPGQFLLPLLLAVASEFSLAACLQILSPTVRAALAADLAIEHWFAHQRVQVEQQLLAAMSRDSATDTRFRYRLSRLSHRLDQLMPSERDATRRA